MQKAIEYNELALAIHRELGDRRSEAITLLNLAGAYAKTGRIAEARTCARQALVLFEETGLPEAEEARRQLAELEEGG